MARARRGFARRYGISLFAPAHDLNAPVAMRLNLQDRGFGLRQSTLFGTHHRIPVVKPDAKIGTIGCWQLVPVGDVYGVAMPVRSCARQAEGEQSRQRNQKKEVASRHGVLPATIDDREGDWSRAIQPRVFADKTIAPSDYIFRRANSCALNLFADPYPLNLYGSIFYKIMGGAGQEITDISFSSDLPNSAEGSSYQNLAPQKFGFIILKIQSDLLTRGQTPHLHRS